MIGENPSSNRQKIINRLSGSCKKNTSQYHWKNCKFLYPLPVTSDEREVIIQNLSEGQNVHISKLHQWRIVKGLTTLLVLLKEKNVSILSSSCF